MLPLACPAVDGDGKKANARGETGTLRTNETDTHTTTHTQRGQPESRQTHEIDTRSQVLGTGPCNFGCIEPVTR